MATNGVHHEEDFASKPPNTLRNPSTFITTHDVANGTAIVHSASPAEWQNVRPSTRFNVIYTTSEFPVSMTSDNDIHDHDNVVKSGQLGLVRPHGTVCRMVDFSPDNNGLMHRTQSLDYGIVVEGEIEMALDSGEVHLLKRGDVAVQRGTMHAWRNRSKTDWARMVFVLQDCKPLTIGSDVLKEDLGSASGEIPASGNH